MTTVEEIVEQWLDDNGPDIVRDEMDVEREIEIQVEKALDEIDVDKYVKEFAKERVETDYKDLNEALAHEQERINELNLELSKQEERIDELEERFIRHIDNLQYQIRRNGKTFWAWFLEFFS